MKVVRPDLPRPLYVTGWSRLSITHTISKLSGIGANDLFMGHIPGSAIKYNIGPDKITRIDSVADIDRLPVGGTIIVVPHNGGPRSIDGDAVFHAALAQKIVSGISIYEAFVDGPDGMKRAVVCDKLSALGFSENELRAILGMKP